MMKTFRQFLSEDYKTRVPMKLVQRTQDKYWDNKDQIKRYARKMKKGGVKFPAILLYKNHRGRYEIEDGHHRFEAHKKVKRKTILARVRQSKYYDWKWPDKK